MKEKIEIPLSKNKLILGLGASVLFVVLAIWMFLNANYFQEHPFKLLRTPIVIKSIGVLGVLIFGATGIFGIKKLFDKKVGLTIDSTGITDHSNASSIGLIEWKDISSVITKQVLSTKFLLINVIAPEKYIGKAQNGMKAKLMQSNMKMYGTPLSITSSTLQYDFEDLEKLILTEFDRHKNIENTL
ncbi:STM3941 family protein [Olleya sp. Bg11-27]|uniref:STM3941 family protein n=1 Tax=Olleya sp. Bg11-27 TaxID=2058135 RepID=UPI000C30ECAF|nr:STM3941 family protein [Olleya sp. Bg11-27]AUC75528.1 hypothetical protein CW732_07510 [Olleya sp. Bg11-27]